MRARLLALVGLALQVSMGSAAAQTSRAVSDEAAIRTALEDWVEAANAGDEDRANTIWAPDLIGWYPGQPDDTYEREVTAAAERRRSGSRPRFEIGLNVVEVMVSGDQAVVRDVWTFTPRAKDGSPAQTIRGFEVWKRQPDGAWRIARWISAPEPSVSTAAHAASDSSALSAADRAAVHAVQEAYRQAWLANDAAAVMRTLTEDVVLIPHHGVPPVEGAAAVRDFWWPADGPPTTITAFDLENETIAGSGDLAYLRGRFTLAWTQGEAGREESFRNEGNFLSILRREADGGWRIALQTWNDPPNQPVDPAAATDPDR